MSGVKPYLPVKWKHLKKRVIYVKYTKWKRTINYKAQRVTYTTRLDSIEKDYRQGLDSDLEEQAVQLENAEVQEAIAKSTSEEQQRIEEKLAKLA